MFTTAIDFYHFVQLLFIFNKTGQIAHIPSPSSVIVQKLSLRVTALRQLVGSGWDTAAKTLRRAALSLIYSTAEYCVPAWCRSVHIHLIDSVLNDASRILTEFLGPTLSDHLTYTFRYPASSALPTGNDWT